MSYQPSINIVYDIGKGHIFEEYVPNIKQLDIINELLSSTLTGVQHAHLLVGPYGAGKSLVGAMTASLLTEEKKTRAIKAFFKDVRTVSPELEGNISLNLKNRKLKWIPITITGKSGEFENIILENLQKQCKLHGIDIVYKHDGSYIIDLINIWKKSYLETYVALELELEQAEYTVEILLDKLKLGETAAVALFKMIYPKIAVGTHYYNPNKLDFQEQLEFIFQQLEKARYGIYIVFDEFGRFLQNVSNTKISTTMQQIQDMAELVNRIRNVGMLFITHTGLQQYANSNINLAQAELERVEKRFVEHRLESDSATFYRSAHKLLQNAQARFPDMFLAGDYDTLNKNIVKYNLFAGMSPEEIEGTIIEGCQPIHPLVIQLLPSLSNILGQNDRTLYMFLNQFDIEAHQGEWYYADQLFDYFYPDGTTLLKIDTLKYYRLALSYQVSDIAVRLVKLATLLNFINNRFLLKIDFLQFSLGIEPSEVESVIEELKQVKLLRFNPFTKAYELYEGSLVEFEGVFEQSAQSIVISDEMRVVAIERVFDEKYYLPLGYNTAKSMTRYIESKFALGQHELDYDSLSDGVLVYIISRNTIEKVQIEQYVANYMADDVLFAVTNINFETIAIHVDRYVILNEMLKNTTLINSDSNLKYEIELQIETSIHELQRNLNMLKDYSSNSVAFYMQGEPVTIPTLSAFEEYLDTWIGSRFPHTPEVRNESFNKRKVMPIQRKSAINLLDQILDSSFNGNFTIEGFGPDYLIAATTFKNLSFNFANLDEQTNMELGLLRAHLTAYLENNNHGSILNLFKVAMDKPFGIREALVPLFVVALLKDKWHQMAFYSNDFNIPHMTAVMLYEILEQNAEIYIYEIYTLSDEMVNQLQHINEVFCQNHCVNHPYIIFKELSNWLFSLPRYVQITDKQPKQVLTLKQIIRASETDPLKAISEVVELGLDAKGYYGIKEHLDGFISAFKELLIQETFNVLEISTNEEVNSKYQDVIQQSPQFLELADILTNNEDFIDNFIVKVVGVPLNEWSDVTYDSYFATLSQLKSAADSEEIRLMDGDQVITTIKEVELSVKGNTIYDQLQRIVSAGGRTMNHEEVKYILFKILQGI